MPLGSGGPPLLTWSGLRFLVHRSNLLTVVFGAVVVFSLPEALLSATPACTPARHAVISMGHWFVVAALGLGLTTLLLGVLAPATHRSHANLTEYVLGETGQRLEDKKNNWDAADAGHWPPARYLIIAILTASAAAFFVSLCFALSFLSESRACIDLPQEPPSIPGDRGR